MAAARGELVPRHAEEVRLVTLAVELTPAPDPLETCARFTGLPHLCFLDSSARGPLGRHSFLTADPIARVSADSDPLAAARALLAPHHRAPLPRLPPFQGGIAGYLAYEWGADLEHVRRPHGTHDVPDAVLGLYDWVIAWDHVQGRAWIVAWGKERLAWQDGVATFHAGAGIVWDSDPAAEYDETLAKARALIDALTSPRKMSRTRGPVRRPA